MNQTYIALMVRYAIGSGNFDFVVREKAKDDVMEQFALKEGVKRKEVKDAEQN